MHEISWYRTPDQEIKDKMIDEAYCEIARLAISLKEDWDKSHRPFGQKVSDGAKAVLERAKTAATPHFSWNTYRSVLILLTALNLSIADRYPPQMTSLTPRAIIPLGTSLKTPNFIGTCFEGYIATDQQIIKRDDVFINWITTDKTQPC